MAVRGPISHSFIEIWQKCYLAILSPLFEACNAQGVSGHCSPFSIRGGEIIFVTHHQQEEVIIRSRQSCDTGLSLSTSTCYNFYLHCFPDNDQSRQMSRTLILWENSRHLYIEDIAFLKAIEECKTKTSCSMPSLNAWYRVKKQKITLHCRVWDVALVLNGWLPTGDQLLSAVFWIHECSAMWHMLVIVM